MRQQTLEHGGPRRGARGPENRQVVETEYFPPGPSEESLGARVPEENSMVQVAHDDGVLRQVQQFRLPPQGLLRPLAIHPGAGLAPCDPGQNQQTNGIQQPDLYEDLSRLFLYATSRHIGDDLPGIVGNRDAIRRHLRYFVVNVTTGFVEGGESAEDEEPGT